MIKHLFSSSPVDYVAVPRTDFATPAPAAPPEVSRPPNSPPRTSTPRYANCRKGQKRYNHELSCNKCIKKNLDCHYSDKVRKFFTPKLVDRATGKASYDKKKAVITEARLDQLRVGTKRRAEERAEERPKKLRIEVDDEVYLLLSRTLVALRPSFSLLIQVRDSC